MTIHASLNDVNLAAVGQLVGAIQEEPERAATRWQATVSWDGGFRSVAQIREFARTLSDEPLGLGGTDTAPNPVEQLLAALGNCLVVGYAANATVAGIAIRDLRIELEGDVDLQAFLGLHEGHAGFSSIQARVHLESDGDAEQLRALHQKVVSSSPVGHTLARPIPVEIELV